DLPRQITTFNKYQLSKEYSVITLSFLSCHAHHRNLHSFPTRRSSDLGLRREQFAQFGRQHHVAFNTQLTRHERHHTVGVTGNDRSEEHTSELQSRENLVCRLLLEKKKKQYKRT